MQAVSPRKIERTALYGSGGINSRTNSGQPYLHVHDAGTIASVLMRMLSIFLSFSLSFFFFMFVFFPRSREKYPRTISTYERARRISLLDFHGRRFLRLRFPLNELRRRKSRVERTRNEERRGEARTMRTRVYAMRGEGNELDIFLFCRASHF